MIKDLEAFKNDASLQNAIKRNCASRNSEVVYNGQVRNGLVQNVKSELENMSNQNVEESVWREGDVFTVPSADILEQSLFSSKFGVVKTPGITVKLDNADKSKNLYFSTLRKSAQPYNEQMIAVGEPVHSDTPLYEEVMAAPTMLDVFNLIASKANKKIRVAKVENVQTLRYSGSGDNRVATGIRNTQIPFFVCE